MCASDQIYTGNVHGDVFEPNNLIRGNLHGNILNRHNTITGDMHGDIFGPYNFVRGNLHGNILNTYNIIIKNMRGDVFGSNNTIWGDLYGSLLGADNTVHGVLYGKIGGVDNIAKSGIVNDGEYAYSETMHFEPYNVFNAPQSMIQTIVNGSRVMPVVGTPYYSPPLPCSSFLTTIPFGNSLEKKKEALPTKNTIIFSSPVMDEVLPDGALENTICIICMTNKRVVVFIPCSHMVYCGSCAKLTHTKAENSLVKCPICRVDITQMINVIQS
jgi:hypothetical protein